jgi:hypothetical protein
MHPRAPIKEAKATDRSQIYFLYRYRPFRDQFNSLQRMLSENLWWFGSRTGFDDELDCVLGGTMITNSEIERKVRESGGTESGLHNALNDPSLAARVQRSVQKQAIDSIGNLCLSDLPDDPQLWREYADCGHGACLCLAIGKLLVSKEYSAHKPQEVRYFDAPLHIWNPEAKNQLTETAATLLRKNRKWEHQREFRILWPDGVGHHSMPTDSLRAVITGARLSEAERRRIASWVKAGPWNPMPTILTSRRPR